MKKLLKVVLWLVGGLVALVVLFHAEEYLRGRYLWERHLRELAAQGDTLDIRKLVPPPIPDDQNMAAAPIFAELYATNRPDETRLGKVKLPDVKAQAGGSWLGGQKLDLSPWRAAFSNDNLLAALANYAPVLQEVEAAAQRPQARFNVRYEDGPGAFSPHIGSLLKLAKVYRIKTLVELAAGHADAALGDVRLTLRLAKAMEDEPSLISILVRASMIQLAIQPMWEGMAQHRWKREHLLLLQQDFANANLLKQMDLVLQGKRCGILWWQGELLSDLGACLGPVSLTHVNREPLAFLIPKGWIYINCLNTDLSYQQYVLPALDSRAQRIHPDRLENETNIDIRINSSFIPYHYMEAVLLPECPRDIEKIAFAQTAVQQAATACALERYRLAHGRYPDTLAALVPQYLAAVPNDVMDGQPLRYRLEGADGFILYSIGWNMKDDGGQVAWIEPTSANDNPRLDDKAGDWVWRSQPVAQ